MNPATELSDRDRDRPPQRRSGRLPAWRTRSDSRALTGGPDRPWRRMVMPVALLLAGPVVVALADLGAPGWLRAGPVLGYVAIVPGLAWARLLGLAERVTELLLGVALSLAFGAIFAQLMIYLHAWSASLWLVVLAVIASCAGGWELYRPPAAEPVRRWSRPSRGGPR